MITIKSVFSISVSLPVTEQHIRRGRGRAESCLFFIILAARQNEVKLKEKTTGCLKHSIVGKLIFSGGS